jgi:hypothetical protein
MPICYVIIFAACLLAIEPCCLNYSDFLVYLILANEIVNLPCLGLGLPGLSCLCAYLFIACLNFRAMGFGGVLGGP